MASWRRENPIYCSVVEVAVSDAGNIRAQRFVVVLLRHNIWKMEARECKTLVKQVRPDWSTPINVCLNTQLIGQRAELDFVGGA